MRGQKKRKAVKKTLKLPGRYETKQQLQNNKQILVKKSVILTSTLKKETYWI